LFLFIRGYMHNSGLPYVSKYGKPASALTTLALTAHTRRVQLRCIFSVHVGTEKLG